MSDWQPIETAPKDGTVFIARNADYPKWGSWPMLRHVRWLVTPAGTWEAKDMGAWLHVCDNSFDEDAPEDTGPPWVPFAYAADKDNKSVRYEWMSLPDATP